MMDKYKYKKYNDGHRNKIGDFESEVLTTGLKSIAPLVTSQHYVLPFPHSHEAAATQGHSFGSI